MSIIRVLPVLPQVVFVQQRLAGLSTGNRPFALDVDHTTDVRKRAGQPIFPHALEMSEIRKNSILDNMVPKEGMESFIQFLKNSGATAFGS